MKKTLYWAAAALFMFVSCESESMDPVNPNSTGGGTTGGGGGNSGGGSSGGGNSGGGGQGSTVDAIVYTGASITFEKAASTSPTDPSNQDRITDLVWITRGSRRGIYNAAEESGYVKNSSPAGTEWAEGSLDDFDTLTYADWETAVLGNPPSSVGKQYVVHLIEENIYLQLEFLSWGQGSAGGGSFSYSRSTPSQ